MNRRQARTVRRLAECVLDARAVFIDYLLVDDPFSLHAAQRMWPFGDISFGVRVAAPVGRRLAREERRAHDAR